MYGEQHQPSYRNGGGRGGSSSGNGNGNGNSGSGNKANASTGSKPAIPQRRSGANASKQVPNGNTNTNTSSGAGGVAAAVMTASSSGGVASSSPTSAVVPPPMPLAAPRSQQLLASPRSPADYQSSPTTSPHGSPGSRGYYGSAFASPSSPSVVGSLLYGRIGADGSQRSGLERLVMEEGLVRTNVPLRELRPMPGTNTVKVGYDGVTILRVITETVQEQDPIAVFTVTTPTALYNRRNELEKEVKAIQEAVPLCSPAGSGPGASPRAFTPVFVFDGIPLNPLLDSPNAPFPSPPTEITPFHGQSANHGAKTLPFNMRKLVAERFRIEDDVERYFICTMRGSFPEVFRAPYNAWAQLSSFFSPTNRYISEVCGCLELLAFPGVDRVILKFNPELKTFDYVEKQAVLAAINGRLTSPLLTERDLSYIILTDTQQKPYRLPFLPDTPNAFDELIAKFAASEPLPDGRGRGFNFARNYYRDRKQYLNTNYSLLDAPVFTPDGTVLPLYTVYGVAPHSSLRARETFGAPLPPVLYFALFAGLAMPNSLAAVGQSLLSDHWPLIDSAEYRKLLDFLAPIRLRTCLHLLSVVPRADVPTRWYRQYVSPKLLPREKLVDVRAPEEIPLYEWNIAGNEVIQEREPQYFMNVLPFYTTSMLPLYSSSGPPAYYHTVPETTASVLLKTIDQLGYFTHSVEEDGHGPIGLTTELSICASALSYFNCETLSEYGLLCLELLRTCVLNDDPIQLTPSTNRQYLRDCKPGSRFASRLLSIIPVNIGDTWGGPFDPEIAAFGSIARVLSRTIRLLMESITINTFCLRHTSLPLSEMYEVLNRLPFGLPTEFGAGHLMNYILHNEECSIEELQAVFPECSALPDDLGTLFWFWSMAISAIRKLAEETPSIDVDMVATANEAVIQAALRLDPVNFGYLTECRKEVEAMIAFRIAAAAEMSGKNTAEWSIQP